MSIQALLQRPEAEASSVNGEAITNVCAAAVRQPHVLGVSGPSKWDDMHAKIDALLDDYEQAPA